MHFTVENILLVGSILIFSSIIAGKTGYRFGLPALLLFLIVGMLFGVGGLGFRINNTEAVQFIGMISLTIILFAGGMETKISDIRPIMLPGFVLSTLGVILTTIFTGLFIWYISSREWSNIYFSLTSSLLLAATMSSTDSASVFTILRTQKINLKHNLKPLLELESGSNDPMAYMLTIVLIQFILSSEMAFGSIISSFFIQFLVGSAAGYGLGRFAALFINKINVDNTSFYPILLLAFAFFTFSVTELISGNGYLAVYIAGIIVGNEKLVRHKEITTFMDGISWLFQIIMFLVLGILVNPNDMFQVAFVSLLIGVFIIFIGRPLSVFLCLAPFKLNTKFRLFVSWVGLRGAAPIIFATYTVVANVEDANKIFNVVFFITILSLLIQGTTIPFIAKKLNLSTPIRKPKQILDENNEHEKAKQIVVTPEMLHLTNTLGELDIPEGHFVIFIKRDDDYLIPTSTLKLKKNDKLYLMIEKQNTN